MPRHKRRRPKNRRSGCLLCKPHKSNGLKGSLKAQTIQEQKAVVDMKQQPEDEANHEPCPVCEDQDGGCIYCGMPCPEGEHVWGGSDLEGPGWRRCKRCFADDYVEAA